MGINERQDRYYALNAVEIASCKAFTTNWKICNQEHMVYNTYNNMTCEIAIFTHAYKKSVPWCEIERINKKQVWSKLHATNQYMFTVAEPMAFKKICPNESNTCEAKGSGIISLQEKCTLHSGDIEIAASSVTEMKMPIAFTPELNISDIIQEMKPKITPHQMSAEQKVDNLMDQLESALDQQERNIQSIPTIRWHDIHHYTATYIILGIIIAVAVAAYVHQRRSNPAQQITIPLANLNPVAAPRQQRATMDGITFV